PPRDRRQLDGAVEADEIDRGECRADKVGDAMRDEQRRLVLVRGAAEAGCEPEQPRCVAPPVARHARRRGSVSEPPGQRIGAALIRSPYRAHRAHLLLAAAWPLEREEYRLRQSKA